MEYERIFTETPRTAIWSRIDILTTVNGVKIELETRKAAVNSDISDDLILNKSKGVAFCVRSARDLFFNSSSKNLTPSLTSLYYGTYNLLSALLIGDITNTLTLENIENFSKNGGHGLKTIYNEQNDNLVDNEFLYCSGNGFFKEVLDRFGYDSANIYMSKNYKKVEDITDNEIHKLISLKTLLASIPELKNLFVEIFKGQPNYINFHSSKLYGKDAGFSKMVVDEVHNSNYLTNGDIHRILDIPTEHVFEYKKEYEFSKKEEFRCDRIPDEFLRDEWIYHSPIAESCIIAPIVSMRDALLINFMLLYLLSIWTRYRPNLWREISEGELDHLRSLFSVFAESSERIIPNMFLERFYGRNFIFASHSYWS